MTKAPLIEKRSIDQPRLVVPFGSSAAFTIPHFVS